MNCCRKYLEYDPDYTRQLTPENSDDEHDSEDDEGDYSEELPSLDKEDDMEEEDERDEEDTDESLDPDNEEWLNSEERRQLGMYPYDTYQSTDGSSPEPPKQVQNRESNTPNNEDMDTNTPNTS